MLKKKSPREYCYRHFEHNRAWSTLVFRILYSTLSNKVKLLILIKSNISGASLTYLQWIQTIVILLIHSVEGIHVHSLLLKQRLFGLSAWSRPDVFAMCNLSYTVFSIENMLYVYSYACFMWLCLMSIKMYVLFCFTLKTSEERNYIFMKKSLKKGIENVLENGEFYSMFHCLLNIYIPVF